jgi:hypothetical protein
MNWYKRRVIVPVTEADHAAVAYAQRVLGLPETGDMDDETRGHLRGVQSLFKLTVTGILDDATAKKIDEMFPEGA